MQFIVSTTLLVEVQEYNMKCLCVTNRMTRLIRIFKMVVRTKNNCILLTLSLLLSPVLSSSTPCPVSPSVTVCVSACLRLCVPLVWVSVSVYLSSPSVSVRLRNVRERLVMYT